MLFKAPASMPLNWVGLNELHLIYYITSHFFF